MKGYTIGDNTNKKLSRHPWRLDDEKLVYPAYAKFLEAGLKNVYADVGQLFAQSTIADPRVSAVMMGQLVRGLGADHVCWGTDAIWTGSPQWQIEALRRLEIPDELQKKHGLKALGPADGPVKTAIFGGNNARLYDFKPEQRAALETDRIAQYKEVYAREGAGRTNLAYGYALK
jgi:hypothetical protein